MLAATVRNYPARPIDRPNYTFDTSTQRPSINDRNGDRLIPIETSGQYRV